MTHYTTKIIAAVAVLAAATAAPFALAADGTLNVLINGQAPNGYCVAGPITVTASGVTGQQGGTWHLAINYGDGTATSTTNISPTGSNKPYSVTRTQTPIGTSTGIRVVLYHSQPSGQDGQVFNFQLCAAPPTTGVVILAKNVVNDNLVQKGTATSSNFTLSIGGQDFMGSAVGTIPGAILSAGNYSITETGPSGYTRTGTTCVDMSNNSVVSTGGSITVAAGKNYKCTVTNNDDAPVFGTLKVIKQVTGGSALVSAFTLSVKDVSDVIVGSAAGSAIGTEYNLVVGTYTVSEAANLHYTAAFSGACNSNGVVTLANGTSECTVTNTYHNSAPIAISDSYSTDEDVTLTVEEEAGVLVNDSDPEGDNLVAAIATEPTKGTVTLNGNGSFDYVPNANANGIDTFTYTAYDGVDETSEVEVTITINPVNDAPVAQNDADNTNEDTAVTTDDVRGNDSDVDGDSLIVSAFDAVSVEGGTVVNNGDGTFTYTPSANFGGSDSFTYTISDGNGGTDTATVTIEVSGQNDAPVAVTDIYSVNEDTTLTKDAAAGVLDNDHDTDGGALKAVLDTNVVNGTLTLNEDGSFEYVPEANYVGPVSFTYHVEDESGASSNEVTVTITVNAVNDAPVAVDQNISTGINIPKAGAASATDVDGDSLVYELASTTANGILDFLPNGLFNYAPAVNFTGSDFFTFFANDGDEDSNTATVTIDVSGDPENTLDLCKDGVDNDNDEDIDLDDSDCTPFIPHLTLTKIVNGGDHDEDHWTLIASSTSMTISGKTGEASVTSAVVDPGVYTISEDGPGHYSAHMSCTKDGQTTLEGGSQISIEIGDTNVRCTITNTFTEYTSDLSVMKSVDTATPDANQTIVYTITVANAGPDAATNVTVSDVLPGGVSFASAVASQGSYSSDTGLWTVGALAAGGEGSSATLTITVQVTAEAQETVVNTASASSSNEDANSGNNSQASSFTVARSGSNSTSGSRPQGSVLGAFSGQVLGETCGLYMDQHLKRGGAKNNATQVSKLQDFLNKHSFGSFPSTGYFGPLTEGAVKAFQAKYADEVLKPWSISAPTGLVYLTTIRQINNIECPDLMLPVPANLIPWSSNPNAQ
jgi:uncharacterized repeat protein (TIGR01451 family)